MCHRVYIDHADSRGTDRLVPIPSDPVGSLSVATPRHDVLKTHAEPAVSAGKGKEVKRDLQPLDAPGFDKGPASTADVRIPSMSLFSVAEHDRSP